MKKYVETRVNGFTLIEILVALTIIGVLLTFVAPLVLNRPDQARNLKVKNDFSAIETAMILYRLDNGRFPNSDEGLKILVNKENASEGYLARAPIDPWGNSYKLYFDASGSVQIRSAGPDGFFDETGNSDDKISKKIQ